MSSLQKFHRRTQSVVAATWPPVAIGGGDATRGFWLGGPEFNALVVAPKSTEAYLAWGSYGTARGTVSTTNGLTNTYTLYAFGSAAHPLAYAAKILTTGGYNTWYLPAKDELNTLYSNKDATPFATSNAFVVNAGYWSSTEFDGANAYIQSLTTGVQPTPDKNNVAYGRAVRRV